MATKPNYLEILAEYWPEIQAYAPDPEDYDSIVLNDPSQTLPTKEELDTKALYIVRKEVWKEIQEMRDTRSRSGVKVNGYWYHNDDTSRIQQIALVMFGQNMPTGIMWKTMQGTFSTMTPQLAGQLFQAIAQSDQLNYAKAEAHRQNMILSDDPLSYDYSTGWPMIYSESPEAAALVDYQ